MAQDASSRTDLLIVKNLSIHFGDVYATRHVSFSIRKGECLGIVGESGSGKSVSALATIGLLPLNARIAGGEVEIMDPESGKATNLLSLPEKMLRTYRGRDISMIFQEPMTSLNPVMRCGEQVGEVLRQHLRMRSRDAKMEVLRLFEEVKIPRPESAFNSFPHQLSGGQRQRVMIAQAIACRPRLLIADEPTTALDVTVQKAIVELLRELQAGHGMSMIFITHDLGLVSRVADHIAVMNKGEVVEYGRAMEVLRTPVHPYTRGLLACRPTLDTSSRRLPTVADFMRGNTEAVQQNAQPDASIDIGYDQPPILTVEALKVSFPTKKNFRGKPAAWLNAVDEVSMEIWKGETLGLVGESGCGKTTLGRAILGLQPAVSGKVNFDGKELTRLKPSEMKPLRKRMQIIFQDPYSSLNPRQRVGPAIMEPMKVHGLHGSAAGRKQAVLELMAQVGLEPDAFHRYPHEFSGGQRQRICIARALAVQPEFIVCDESVSALDVSVQAQVLNLLKDLKERYRLTYIFISHDLSVVKYMADRIAVMNRGKIVELQKSVDVYKHPREEYTKRLIEAIPKY